MQIDDRAASACAAAETSPGEPTPASIGRRLGLALGAASALSVVLTGAQAQVVPKAEPGAGAKARSKDSREAKDAKDSKAGRDDALVDGRRIPAPIRAMIDRGDQVRVLRHFDAPGSLTGWVLVASTGEHRIFYVTPDEQYAIYGLVFNAKLDNVTGAHLREYGSDTSPEKQSADARDAEQLARALELARKAQGAMVEGKGPQVFVVFDPTCPHCHSLYRAFRPYASTLQIVWIPVGVLSDRAGLLAEAFVQSPDRQRAMADAMAGRLAPVAKSVREARAAIDANREILDAAGATSVPLVVFSDGVRARGSLGVPTPEALKRLAQIAK